MVSRCKKIPMYGKNSFFNWAFNEKNPHKKYIEECQGIFHFFKNEKLYITKEEQEEKNRIYQNAIQPNENRENLENKAIEIFGKDKVEIID
uniref:Uncharacterized protein n=2 Tax=Beet leafhopper transmitted virescence phytoplasma TaxID=37694 RepID=Q6JKM6_9MOLU|nr:unknown [Beet leafhopper transmitted virescence phytoplasma]AAR84215.1 unknown [Beet leafhopper transmitted virescence phytoplasma]